MKTKFILFILLLIAGVASAQVKKVAILEVVDKTNRIEYSKKLMLRTSLSQAIAQTPGYEVYDRNDIDAIMSEHSFQRSGLVSNDQIKRLGEMTGANYVLVAEAVHAGKGKLFVTAKLLDVETARTIITEQLEIDDDHMQKGCEKLAAKMFPKRTSSVKKQFTFSDGPQLVRNSKIDQKLLGIGKYSCDGVQMDQKAMEGFLRNNSYEVYKRYLRGQSCVKAGWTFFTIGLVGTIAGSACFILSEEYNHRKWEFVHELEKTDVSTKRGQYLSEARDYYRKQEVMFWDMGIGVISGGGSMLAISVPLLSTGYGIKNNIHKRYNECANPQPTFTLNLQNSNNGIGLALTF